MRKSWGWVLGLVLVLQSGSCAVPGGGAPDWVTGPPAAYPDSNWVTASASGSSDDSARSSARAELSRVFRSRVESVVRDRARSTVVRDEGDAPRSTLVETLEIDTRVETEASFDGVRVAETWRDRQGGTWHALAVVEKRPLRAALATRAAEAARRIRSALDRAESAPTPLGRARALRGAAAESRARDVLVARARVAGAGPDGFVPTTAEIERQLDTVLWRTRVQVLAVEVDPSGSRELGPLPGLREAFEEGLTGLGFRLAGAGEGADLVVTSRMLLEEVPRGFKGHFVRWEGSYEVAGASGGSVLLSSQGSGGESYSSLSVARARSLAAGSRKLTDELRVQIQRYLQADDDH